MRYFIDTVNRVQWAPNPVTGKDIPPTVIEVDKSHPYFAGYDTSRFELDWGQPGVPLVALSEVTSVARTAASNRTKSNGAARQLLCDTDWYVLRYLETGTPIPADITAAREKARKDVIE